MLQGFTGRNEAALTFAALPVGQPLSAGIKKNKKDRKRPLSKVEESHASYIWMNGDSIVADIVWASATHVELMVENGTHIPEDGMVALVLRGFLSLPMRVTQQQGSCVVLSFVQAPHRSVVEWISDKMVTPETKAIREFMEENAMPEMAEGIDGVCTGEPSEVEAQLADLYRARTQSFNYMERSYGSAEAA